MKNQSTLIWLVPLIRIPALIAASAGLFYRNPKVSLVEIMSLFGGSFKKLHPSEMR